LGNNFNDEEEEEEELPVIADFEGLDKLDAQTKLLLMKQKQVKQSKGSWVPIEEEVRQKEESSDSESSSPRRRHDSDESDEEGPVKPQLDEDGDVDLSEEEKVGGL